MLIPLSGRVLTDAAEVFDWDERALRASQARSIVSMPSQCATDELATRTGKVRQAMEQC